MKRLIPSLMFFLIVWFIQCAPPKPLNLKYDVVLMPRFVMEKTLSFMGDTLFFNSIDSGLSTVNCFSLKEKELIWSMPINEMSINKGVVSNEGKYIIPTLSENVYLFSLNGAEEILKLKYRCKIDPLVVGDILLLHDRGVGIKAYRTDSMILKWIFKQNDEWSISQPYIIDSSFVVEINDSVFSLNPFDGSRRWGVSLNSHTDLNFLYCHTNHLVLVIGTSDSGSVYIKALKTESGNQRWTNTVSPKINLLDRSCVIIGDLIYCKGENNSVIVISLIDGKVVHEHLFESSVTSNLISYNGKVVCLLKTKKLVVIDQNSRFQSYSFEKDFGQFYINSNSLYLVSGKSLYHFISLGI